MNKELPLYLFETIEVDKKKLYKYKGIYEFVAMSKDYPKLAVELVNTNLVTASAELLIDVKNREEKELNKLLNAPINKIPEGNIVLSTKQVIVNYYKRDQAVVAYALERAKGHCEICGSPAPFIKKSNGKPYLEVHHMIPLSQDGLDIVGNVKALCPNCHRKEHFG